MPGGAGKGRHVLSPPQHTVTRSAISGGNVRFAVQTALSLRLFLYLPQLAVTINELVLARATLAN